VPSGPKAAKAARFSSHPHDPQTRSCGFFYFNKETIHRIATLMHDDHQRPVTLYVENIDTKPNLPRIERERTSTLDIEITEQAAEQLHKFLAEQISAGIPGALRVRLTGRLTIY
jgi:hypothetical protein